MDALLVIRVKAWLLLHPSATAEEVAKRFGISFSQVQDIMRQIAGE